MSQILTYPNNTIAKKGEWTHFINHPLITPITEWLSKEITYYQEELECFANFVYNIVKIDRHEHNEEMKKTLPVSIVKLLPYQPYKRRLYDWLILTNYIDLIPPLVNDLMIIERCTTERAKKQKELLKLVNSPQKTTPIEDLLAIVPLKSDYFTVHFLIFCQLWPKWRKVKAG